MDKAHKAQILLQQQLANQQLALGHFNLDAAEPTPALLCDVLDMCVYAQVAYLEQFECFSM